MATPIPPNDAPLDAAAAAAAAGGRVVRAGQGRLARGITTDSRAVRPGCAFVALRGQRHDGHAYVDAAIDAGAVLVVCERGRAPADARGADVVEVDDTLSAWGAIARAHLRAWRRADPRGRTVAITGSAGKTTTKEMCAALLGAAGCLATTGNLNNRVGLPAVALQVGASHRFVVLEMGMSERGEIAQLAAIAEPDVAVVTNVGLAHAGGVGGTIDDVAREKGALFEALRAGAVAVANADDAQVVRELRRAPSARVTTFGAGERADYRLAAREPTGDSGSLVTVERRSGGRSVARVPVPGAAAAIDFVAALAAAEAAAGVELEPGHVAAAMSSMAPVAGRMQVRRLRGHVIVLDDTYNASPATVRAALATLAEVAAGRRVAVLGEMKELGGSAEREHEAVGRSVAEAGVGLLVTCGGLADAVAGSARRAGVPVVAARDVADAARVAAEQVRPGDTVLVKASRSVTAERVVEALVGAYGAEDGR